MYCSLHKIQYQIPLHILSMLLFSSDTFLIPVKCSKGLDIAVDIILLSKFIDSMKGFPNILKLKQNFY